MPDAADILDPVLPLDEVQGNILVGFNMDHQAVLPLHLPDEDSSRPALKQWLARFSQQVTWLREVVSARAARRDHLEKTGTEPPASDVARYSVAFSFPGLEKLTADVAAFEPVFKSGLANATVRLGDPTDQASPGSAGNWIIGGPESIPDALVTIAHDNSERLEEVVTEFLESAAAVGITCPHYDIGHDLSHFSSDDFEYPPGREHFGFKDGISQPGVRGRLSSTPDDWLTRRQAGLVQSPSSSQPAFSAPGQPLVAVGEFLLGYRRQSASFGRQTDSAWGLGSGPDAIAPEWAKNGSFLVYRRLRQDVPAFNRFLNDEAARLREIDEFANMTAERLGALLVGRWRSGAPVLRTPDSDLPSLGKTAGANNAFGFHLAQIPNDGFPNPVSTPSGLSDPLGHVCPQAAHIRKVNPRDLSTEQGSPNTTLVHRILRRGIPYGSPLPFGSVEDSQNQDRGLLFLCYQASIREQFEFLSANWMNDSCTPSPFCPIDGSGHDMIVGQTSSDSRNRFIRVGKSQTKVETTSAGIGEWIIPTGGGYFFAPSRSAIQDVLAD